MTMPAGTRVDYLLDGWERRVGRKIDGTLVQGFLYQDDLRPIVELDGAGTVISQFVYAAARNVPAYMIKGGVTYRIITDQLGSPRVVVDVASGQVVQRLDYDEFGIVLLDTNPGFQPFGFAGGLYDPLTELVHFGAREYDAESGRWTARDPGGFTSGPNLYMYADNDPVNLIDPLGNNPHFRGRVNAPGYNPAPPVNPAVPPPPPPPPPAAPVAPPPPAGPVRPPDPNVFRIASQPVYKVPVAPPPTGTVYQCSRIIQFLRGGGSVAVAFAVGYGIGTAIDQTFDLSDDASDRGVRAREWVLQAGYTESTAGFAGITTMFGSLSPTTAGSMLRHIFD
jgi:RHS repeat-associated protein